MGSIRKKGAGYEAAVCVNGRRKSRSFKLKGQAVAWINEVEQHGFAANKTVGQLLEKYRDEVSPTKRGGKWEIARIGLLSRMPLYNVRLDILRSEHISAWRDARVQEVKNSSVNREWTLLSAVFSMGIEWGWILNHPMRNLQRPKSVEARSRVFTDDEIEAICKEAPRSVSLCFRFALETAMRAGEITKLRRENIYEKHVHLPAEITKTGHARVVPLSKKAREILDQCESDPVFGITSDSLSVMFRRARDKAGVSEATFHDSRRTALTRLAKKMPVETLAKISGHRDLRTLLNVYFAPGVDDLTQYFD